jgi:hypothetical protein
MSTTTLILIGILVVIIIAAAGAWTFYQRRRTDRLRNRFGPEYAREVREVGNRRHAEAKLRARETSRKLPSSATDATGSHALCTIVENRSGALR